MADNATVFVGVDWATQTHQVCALDPAGQTLGERPVAHRAPDLAALGDWLSTLSGGGPGTVWIAIEVPRGPVVETLLERGFAVFSINPKQLDRFRDRFSVAGAKDDRLDARVLADSLRTDPAHFRRLSPEAPEVIRLREWSRLADDLKQERTRLANRFGEQLRRYFPQMLDLGARIAEPWLLDLWERIPTPKAARRVRVGSIQAILKRHHIRRITATEVLDRLRQPPLIVAPGTVEAAQAHLAILLPRLRLGNEQIGQCEQRLDRLLAQLAEPEDDDGSKRRQRDATILRSLPGVGRVVLATLLAEAPEALHRRDYHTLRALCGVAPVTRQSGKRRTVLMRKACHPRLREALYHWARVAAQHEPLSRKRYVALRERGHRHGRALRGVGDRLLYVACTLLTQGELYDPGYGRDQQPTEAA
jgi:transposase